MTYQAINDDTIWQKIWPSFSGAWAWRAALPNSTVLCRNRDGFPRLPFINLVVLLLLLLLHFLGQLFAFLFPQNSWCSNMFTCWLMHGCGTTLAPPPQSAKQLASKPCDSGRALFFQAIRTRPPTPFSQALPKPAISASAPVLYP